MNCDFCGQPAPAPLQGGDGVFCCYGCRELARLLGAAGLAVPRPAAPEDPVPAQGHVAYLRVDGMHCASCERLIEHAALRTRGVLAARASYATGTARIVHDSALIAESGLPTLLSVIGYPARLRGERAPEYDERPDLLRMLTGACLAGAVMMLSFLFVYPLHAGLAEPRDYEAIAWLAFDLTPIALAALTSVVVFYVGWPILRDALTGLRVGMPNMDTLLALAILAAWGYSACQLFLDPLDLYFDVAGSIVAVVTIGRFLERGVRADTLRQLHRVLDAPVPTARVRRDGVGLQCAANEVVPGDRVFVRPGETIPVDGTIVDGIGAVDESLLTGEPFPLARGPGERVLGGAVLREGSLEIDAGAIVQSRIASLASVLWDAQSALGRGPAWVDRMTRVFVPSVLFLAVLVGLARHAGGAAFEQALLASLATLIVACPCTLGLAIPLTTAAATGAALRRGILVTRADLFDRPARIDLVAFDKTGTLSTGVMEVVDVVAHEGADVLTLAAAVERASSHPVAQAIARLDRSRTAREVEIHAGRGACGSVGNRRVAVGSRALFERLGWLVPEAVEQRLAQLARGDSVVSYVGWDGIAHGAILTRDRPRPGWERVIERLRERGPVVMLTGAEHPNGYAGAFDEVFAGVPPEAKAAAVRRLQMRGRVAMVGDGSNDAAALAQADLGIAFGAPTALAAQGAALVVTGDRLERVLDAFALLAATRRRIRQNLGWALGYNAVALPLAMAGLINPLLAALAMAASSIVVVLNAARPLLRDPGAGSEDSARPRERAWAA